LPKNPKATSAVFGVRSFAAVADHYQSRLQVLLQDPIEDLNTIYRTLHWSKV
jgi:hypothetical protein